jgi:hypothetical protein
MVATMRKRGRRDRGVTLEGLIGLGSEFSIAVDHITLQVFINSFDGLALCEIEMLSG